MRVAGFKVIIEATFRACVRLTVPGHVLCPSSFYPS